VRAVYFITHPDAIIDPAIPVPDWRLSPRGLARMRCVLRQPWFDAIGAVWSSAERKALDGAAILSDRVNVLAELGENDRSATGYLPRLEFEALADAFFAEPERSVRGWERAIDAQRRIVSAVANVLSGSAGDTDIAIVSHGGVGVLLFCHWFGMAISRAADQPGGSGGNYFVSKGKGMELQHGWRAIDLD
jgi:broad specificity phosphatase PhoE